MMEAGRFSTEEIARKNGFGNRERMRRSSGHSDSRLRQFSASVRLDPVSGQLIHHSPVSRLLA